MPPRAPGLPTKGRSKLPLRRLAVLLLASLSLFGAACGRSSEAITQTREVTGPWEYRWGDSPRDSLGQPLWAQGQSWPEADADSEGWTRSGANTMPPGRDGRDFLWLRTRLIGPQVADPALYLVTVDQLFMAYLDGKLLYQFGQLDGMGPQARRFLGYRTHIVPLPQDYSGKRLTLRIYSHHLNIGVSGQTRVGSSVTLVGVMLQQDIGKAVVGMILCAVGLMMLALFGLQRSEAAYRSYGGFALTVGLWILCQMQCRALLWNAPLGWFTLEIFSLYTTVGFLLRYILLVFGPGPLHLVKPISNLYFGYAVGAAILAGLFDVPLLATLLPFQVLLLVGIAYMLVMVALAVRRGNSDARVFGAGFVAAALFAAYDTLAALGLVPRSQISLSHFGHGAFTLSLGLILARRFREVHLALFGARQELSEKVRMLQERHVEVQQLNDELRRQIEARSRHIVNSLLDGDLSSSQSVLPILAPGEMLAEHYRVGRVLGQGGMGTVYEVERITDGRRLAAKVLSVRAGKKGLARFAREAQLLAKLKHQNLVTIFDVDVTASQMAYIVMELVEGQNLASLSGRYGDVAFARRVLEQVADVLATVHSQGIVHRDLKPENVLVMHAGDLDRLQVKLVDFGVSMLAPGGATTLPDGSQSAASATSLGPPTGLPPSAYAATAGDPASASISDTDRVSPGASTGQAPAVGGPQPFEGSARRSRPAGITQTGIIVGTPLYMAPELRKGAKTARPASDMFSFGVMAYELMTGELPSEQPPILMAFHPGKRWYPPLRMKCADLPGELSDAIERCLEPQPELRPTAAELRSVLGD